MTASKMARPYSLVKLPQPSLWSHESKDGTYCVLASNHGATVRFCDEKGIVREGSFPTLADARAWIRSQYQP